MSHLPTMVIVWNYWLWAVVLSFGVLEAYSGITKQDTLSQASWGLQDTFPIATWFLVVAFLVLLVHLTNHRLWDPIVWVFRKVVG